MLRAHKTRIRNANPGSSIARALSQHDGATRWAYNALLARLNDATQASPAGALWPSVDDLAKTLRCEKPQWWATVDWEMLDNGRIHLATALQRWGQCRKGKPDWHQSGSCGFTRFQRRSDRKAVSFSSHVGDGRRVQWHDQRHFTVPSIGTLTLAESSARSGLGEASPRSSRGRPVVRGTGVRKRSGSCPMHQATAPWSGWTWASRCWRSPATARNTTTVVKMVDFSYRLASVIDAVYAAPPSQQFKTAPPGTLTQEHRSDPRSSHPASLSHARQPEPDWVCVSASPAGTALQAPVSTAPLSLPSTSTRASLASLHGYGEGDLNAIADGTNPPAGDALGAAKQASGQHQGRSLMYRQPVSLHELHPAHDGTVRRVDLYDFDSFPVTTGQEVRLDLAVAETGQHPGVPPGFTLQHRFLLPEVQPLNHQRLAGSTRVLQPHSPPRLQSTPPPDGGACRRSPAAPATLSRSCHSHQSPTTAR